MMRFRTILHLLHLRHLRYLRHLHELSISLPTLSGSLRRFRPHCCVQHVVDTLFCALTSVSTSTGCPCQQCVCAAAEQKFAHLNFLPITAPSTALLLYVQEFSALVAEDSNPARAQTLLTTEQSLVITKAQNNGPHDEVIRSAFVILGSGSSQSATSRCSSPYAVGLQSGFSVPRLELNGSISSLSLLLQFRFRAPT
jgi:hypothetical protein